MDNGWIKLHRCLIEKAIWKQSQAEQKAVLITILLLANHNSKQWIWSGEKFSVLPGQFITSLDLLAKKSGVSVRSVRTALKNFEKLDFLTNESTKSGRLVTVVNWSLYQSEDELPTKILTKHRQSTDKAPTTNKNDKNDKNKGLKDIYGKFEQVSLTEAEHQKLIDQFGEQGTSERIDRLDEYIASKGVKYKSHYATILSWERKNNGSGKRVSDNQQMGYIERVARGLENGTGTNGKSVDDVFNGLS